MSGSVLSSLRGAATVIVFTSLGCFEPVSPSVPAGRLCDPDLPEASGLTTGVSFEPAEMPCIGLELPEAELRALSSSSRFGTPDVLKAVLLHLTRDCTSPFPEEYPWFEANVTEGGTRTDRVGIRKKGFLGSVARQGVLKPSFKLKTDRYVAQQFIGTTERITLNNGVQDPSRMRDCLAYGVFAAANYPAPMCNLASVVVNGQAMGPYSHIEPIKKRFLERAFGDNSGSLYEGQLADLTPDYLAETGQENIGRWQSKTDETDSYGGPLLALTSALQAPDDSLLAELSPIVDLQQFYRFWALEALIDHADGYTGNHNNFYIYFDPSNAGRGVFIPWGVDAVFRDGNNEDEQAFPRNLSTYTYSELPRRLSRIEESARAFQAELRWLLDNVWQEEVLLDTVEYYAALVRSAQDDSNYGLEVERMRRWISSRRQRVEGFLEEGLAMGAPTAPSCFAIGLDDGLGLIDQASEALDVFSRTW